MTRNTFLIFFAGLAALCVVAFGDPYNRAMFGYAIGAFAFVLASGAIMHFKGWQQATRGHIANCEASAARIEEALKCNKEYAASMTRAEFNLIEALNKVLEDFENLGEEHHAEHQRFSEHIHDALNMVSARVGVRSMKVICAANQVERNGH